MYYQRRFFIVIPILILILTLLTCSLPQNTPDQNSVNSPMPTIIVEEPGMSRENRSELLKGDNLLDMILREGIESDLANKLVMAVAPHLDMVRLQPGQKGIFQYDNGGDLSHFIFEGEGDLVVEAKIEGDEISVTQRTVILTTLVRMVHCTVDTSLYNAAVDGGMPLNVFMDMIQLFSFDVDFQRDLYHGDYFEAAYEVIYNEEGEVVDYGEVVLARMSIRGQAEEFSCFRYTNLAGKRDWYDSQGGTVRKELLRTPINGAYISSAFGNRISPITGYSHTHRGVDFAAPRGTPIMASGRGVVTLKGWSDAYGWFIQIRHANHYQTLYGHMSAFARGLNKGSVVDQGQVIGYVGSTGMSTGPHCHYEVVYYGTKINPTSIKFPPGESLKGEDLELFELERKSLISSFF
jgi:murein DD-endopeptidase MepM/ murein hydrolase activator NlpD